MMLIIGELMLFPLALKQAKLHEKKFQHQDKLLGGYLKRQAFSGKVTGMYFFKKKLTDTQVKTIAAEQCSPAGVSILLIVNVH